MTANDSTHRALKTFWGRLPLLTFLLLFVANAAEAEGVAAVATGQIAHDGRVYCQATRIAPNRIVTAAHCLYDLDRGVLLDTRRLRFVEPGQHVRRIATGAHDPNWRVARRQTAALVSRDLALLVLEPTIRDQREPVDAVENTPCPIGTTGSGVLALKCARARGMSGEGVVLAGRLVGVVSTGDARRSRTFAAQVTTEAIQALERRLTLAVAGL